MSRWSFLLAAPLVLSLAAAGGDASACPAKPSARTARVVHRARVVRVLHVGRAPRITPAPSPAPVSPAPAPEASPVSASSAEAYNVERVNAYRSAAGLSPVTLDATLSAFARRGSQQLMADHVPHGHFRSAGNTMWQQGFTGGAAENQGSPTGWPRAATDPKVNTQRQIDQILASMMGEGPGGGHYRNMMNPKTKRIGVGLVDDGSGKLYLTNDFSE